MSDANGREQHLNIRDSDANVREQWVSVSEAAAALGLSMRTVQKQAASGKLHSKQEGRRLLICVPVREVDANVREADANQTRLKETPLEEELRSEVAFLRAELTAQREAHTQSESEMRRLLVADRQEIARLREQLAIAATPSPLEGTQASTGEEPSADGETHTQAENDAGKGARRAWWRFWERGV